MRVPGLYQWVAWKTAPTEMMVGTYTGTGAKSQSITGLGFSSGYRVCPLPRAPTHPCTRVSAVAGDERVHVRRRRCPPTYITALGADGFTVGSDMRVNRSGDHVSLRGVE